jgi:hypothetical protein
MKKLVMIESVATFVHRNVIELDENDPIEYALDEFVMRQDDPDFKEFSQKYLGTLEMDHYEISQEEYLRKFDQENDYLKSHSVGFKLSFINKITKD